MKEKITGRGFLTNAITWLGAGIVYLAHEGQSSEFEQVDESLAKPALKDT
ncbi:MAG: hypothetical protein GTO14_22310 [Anaerolineales bacterium]|nr:hypothetical protein [Anaerolineales bacterium]